MKLLTTNENKATVPNGSAIVRMKFAKARRFLNPVNYIIQMGYVPRKGRKKRTAIGRAMSTLLHEAMVGTYPDIEVDPSLAKLTLGIKIVPEVLAVVRDLGHIFISWNISASRFTERRNDDRVILCAYAVEQELAAINDEEVLREDGQLHLDLPDGMEALKVHLYLMVHDRSKNSFSDSRYLGLF